MHKTNTNIRRLKPISTLYAQIFCWLLCFLQILGHAAEVESKTVEAKGAGKNRQEAIQMALLEAISKANGVKLDAETIANTASLDVSVGSKTTSASQEEFTSRLKKASKGYVGGWDVLQEKPGQEYSVVLTVEVLKVKKSADQTNRKTMAVLNFHASGDGHVDGAVVPAAALSSGYRESLLTYLTASRKFAIVDETFKNEVAAIKASNEIGNDVLEDIIAKADQLGADYIAVGISDEMNISNNAIKVGDMSANVRKLTGLLRLRIIKVSSRQTVLAADFPLSKLKNVDMIGAHPESSMFDSAGKAMADRILETIYPIRVSGITESGEVILDRGGESLKAGEIYDIFRQGEQMRDRSTGESLGYNESLVGSVQITRVLPKVSYGKVLKKAADIEVDNICRKSTEEIKSNQPKKSLTSTPVDDLFK